jgi:5''-nucleotidase/2'',3''-cyclic phosphodiesterase and related esterases
MKPMKRSRLVGAIIGLSVGLAVAGPFRHAPAAWAAPMIAQNLTVENELTTRNCRAEQSNLASVIVDAIRNVEKCDAAIMHGSAFGDATIAKGKCSADDLLKAVQYREDNVVIVKLSGAQIRKALENGLKLYPQKSPEFLQVSGLTLTVDPGAEKEKRIVEVRVGSSKLEDGKKYLIAMPSPLANGALGYYKIWDKSQAVDHETSKTVGQAVSDYLSSRTTLGAKSEERIVFKK